MPRYVMLAAIGVLGLAVGSFGMTLLLLFNQL